MSRIGKLPVKLPSSVQVELDNSTIKVKGSKGELSQDLLRGVKVTKEDDSIMVTRDNDLPKNRANHGLMRTLIYNMVVGVSEGFSKKLELHGVGYRVAMAGNQLKLSVGFSHDVMYQIPEDIQITVEQNIITVSGISKQRVGQEAAKIRSVKKPEPYKGKGIRYQDEHIIRKSGKSGKDK